MWQIKKPWPWPWPWRISWKCGGDNTRPNGRTQYWYALPPKANLRNFLWFGRMRPWDLSWQTSPWIWSVAWFVSKLTFWTWTAWRSRSELEDLKWDTIPHPSFELWNTGCKAWFPWWSEVDIRWPLSLTELALLVPLPEPAGWPPWWKTHP